MVNVAFPATWAEPDPMLEALFIHHPLLALALFVYAALLAHAVRLAVRMIAAELRIRRRLRMDA